MLDPAPPSGLPVLLQGMLVSAGWSRLFGLLRPRLGRVLPLAPAAMAFAAILPVAWLFLVPAPIRGASVACGTAPGTAALAVATHLARGFGIAAWLLAVRGLGRAGQGCGPPHAVIPPSTCRHCPVM